MIDIVIVSDAKTDDLRQLTEQTIYTANLDPVEGMQIYVVEQQPEVNYTAFDNVTTLHYDFPFNYNKCLNYGAKHGSNDYIAFCNNDLIFTEGWSAIMYHTQRHRLASCSPICPRTAKEYNLGPRSGMKLASLNTNRNEVRMLFAGWCFIWTRQIWGKLGGHDEGRKFWTADNASLMQLKRHNLRHGLDTEVTVHHLQSQTLDTLDEQTRYDYEWKQAQAFHKDYGVKLFPNLNPKPHLQ